MAITYTDVLRDNALDALLASFDSGTMTIRTGAAAGAANTATGTVLATIAMPAASFNAAAAGTASMSGAIADAAADATGTAAHFRIVGTGGAVIEGTCGTTGTDMIIDNAAIQLGGNVSINSMTVSMA